MDTRSGLGRDAETLAAELYEGDGFAILDRNYRCGRAGEIDLVARRGHLVVFCEVKSRTASRWGLPAEAVGHAKQARLRRLAAIWLSERRPGAVDIRFDVVSVIVRNGRNDLTHIPDAF